MVNSIDNLSIYSIWLMPLDSIKVIKSNWEWMRSAYLCDNPSRLTMATIERYSLEWIWKKSKREREKVKKSENEYGYKMTAFFDFNYLGINRQKKIYNICLKGNKFHENWYWVESVSRKHSSMNQTKNRVFNFFFHCPKTFNISDKLLEKCNSIRNLLIDLKMAS